MYRALIASVVLTALFSFALAEKDQNLSSPVEVSCDRAGIEWSVFVPSARLVLTVSGPGGVQWKQEYAPDSRPKFGLVDEQGALRPEEFYRWELIVQLLPGPVESLSSQLSPVASGSFAIADGAILPQAEEGRAAVLEEGAPANSLYLDGEGRLGLGTSVPESRLHLKGMDPALTLEDTSLGGGAFTLRNREKGDVSLGLFDQATGQARWLVDSEGRVGINTTNPTSTLTVDGYIETTKGFLVNGPPLPAIAGWGGGAQPLSTEGGSNNFFGIGAGGSITTGVSNSFFGADAGSNNTAGYENSFFGLEAGYHNTTGSRNSFFADYAGLCNTTGLYNSFFGRSAGLSNTVEDANTFVGTYTNLNPGANPVANPVTNATALGYQAYVSRSNSLVLGSIAGVNGATSYVNVGIGLPNPVRQLHLRGPNATFRMDRTADTAAFILCRVDGAANVLKAFVVGTNASGANNGEFIIMDTGTGAGGAGEVRQRIQNNGDVVFSGNISAPNFIPTSSIAFKTNVRTLESAVDLVSRLRGVRFDWKASGEPAVGLIAEEVEQVIPEVVAHDEKDGSARGVNYSSLVAVLVEAVKSQKQTIDQRHESITRQQATIEQQQEGLADLQAKVARLEALLQNR